MGRYGRVGLLLLALAGARAAWAAGSPGSLFRESRPAMGTVYTIECYQPDQESADRVMEQAFEEIERLEALLSNYRPSSELSRISREAGAGPVVTDPETFGFLERAQGWSARSDGAFDLTVGPLLREWGFKARQGHVPTAAEQRAVRAEVGWDKVELGASDHSVRFRTRLPMELDPGSIGKGFAVDSVVRLLREDGVRAAMISAGGSTVYGLGAPPGKPGWPVEVPDPRTPGSVAGVLYLKDTSLSTGACTEKYFVQNGHRYCHIFDPRTLMPVEGVLQSTVVAPSATDSDALSTVVFVLPPARTAEVLRGLAGVKAVVFLTGTAAAEAGRNCVVFHAPETMCAEHVARTDGKGEVK